MYTFVVLDLQQPLEMWQAFGNALNNLTESMASTDAAPAKEFAADIFDQ